mgnify:CR=1 FL=1
MNVSPINFSKSPNFNGLWGVEKKSSIYDDTMGYQITERYYFPFKDETNEEIKAIKEKFNNRSNNFHGGQFYEEFNNICNIEDKLGFTKQHWEQYTKDKQGLTPVVRNFIEASLKMFDLKHYLIK